MKIIGLYGAFDWNSDVFIDKNFSEVSWVHDSGCTIFINGQHICSVSEERLSRKKYDGCFPKKSIEYCLKQANILPEEIDQVLIPSMCIDLFYKQIDEGTLHEKIKKIFKNADIKILSHHLCHAASSIFTSDFNEGSFLTIDGAGTKYENHLGQQILTETGSFGNFDKNKKIINFYPHLDYTNNFGEYYRELSYKIFISKSIIESKIKEKKLIENIGALYESSCGKIMGLSAYGDNNVSDWKDYVFSEFPVPHICFNEIWKLNPNKSVYAFKSPEESAWILQKNFEASLIEYLSFLRKKEYIRNNICLAGGCFLNVLANTRLLEEKIFDNVHVPPFTNDSGLHFGAACYGAFMSNEKINLPKNIALLGKEYSENEVENELIKISDKKIKYKKYENFEDLCESTSKLLSENKIIGWFQGRSEHGPRALGSRSILMNPCFEKNKDILNSKIKHREYWRPFAGVILEEYLEEYFENSIISPYMLFSMSCKKEKISKIPSVIHVDGTCRMQSINKDNNSKLTILLNQFYNISNIPVLLNTSFNDNGEPIVESPYDAIKCFLNIDLDYLVIDNFLVEKISVNTQKMFHF